MSNFDLNEQEISNHGLYGYDEDFSAEAEHRGLVDEAFEPYEYDMPPTFMPNEAYPNAEMAYPDMQQEFEQWVSGDKCAPTRLFKADSFILESCGCPGSVEPAGTASNTPSVNEVKLAALDDDEFKPKSNLGKRNLNNEVDVLFADF